MFLLRKEEAALVGRSTLQPRAVTMIVQSLLIKFCFGNLVFRPIIIMRMTMIVIGKVFLSGGEMGRNGTFGIIIG